MTTMADSISLRMPASAELTRPWLCSLGISTQICRLTFVAVLG